MERIQCLVDEKNQLHCWQNSTTYTFPAEWQSILKENEAMPLSYIDMNLYEYEDFSNTRLTQGNEKAV